MVFGGLGLYHIPSFVVWPQMSPVAILYLGFLICEMGMAEFLSHRTWSSRVFMTLDRITHLLGLSLHLSSGKKDSKLCPWFW